MIMEKEKYMTTNQDFILREIYGKFILMPIRSNKASPTPIFFNEAAAQIWKNASHSENIKELKQILCNEYELKEDSAEACAVEKYILQLMDMNLILEG